MCKPTRYHAIVTPVGLFSRHEIEFESALDYPNPTQDVRIICEFSCDSETRTVESFWDGGRTWRVRFSPDTCGHWEWRSQSSWPADSGLHDRAGEFDCAEGETSNSLSRHGPLRVSASRHHLEHHDGTPFFWMGDTAWNGPLKSDESSWEAYLSDRAKKGFNVIQFVTTQWIGCAGDATGRPAYLGREQIRIEPAFFRRLDQRVNMINSFGMVAAPVLAWAAGWNKESVHLNPGTLSDEQLILLIRYLVARYGAHQSVWILAGDGIYEANEAERWRRIGRAALTLSTNLATIHPGGKLWVAPEFRNEPWFDFSGYQSGHWNDDDNSRWINEGPPSQDWRTEPICPHINLEPCYEGHVAATSGSVISAPDVRRAAYWSLLAAPPAGVSYGANGIWSWETTPEFPLSHPQAGIAPAWHEAIHLPGSNSMSHLKKIFESVEWWRLFPCPELLACQPGFEFPSRFIAAACSKQRDLAMIYSPEDAAVQLKSDFFPNDMTALCYDPENGSLLWERRLSECDQNISTGSGADGLIIFGVRKQ